MKDEQPIAVRLYRRLIGLYPREFRERVGQSMEQTFRDLYRERNSKAVVCVVFLETATGIGGEHFAVTEKLTMKKIISTIALPALIGLAVVTPLIILEGINTSGFTSLGIPVVLYLFLWLLGFAFVLLLVPSIRDIRSGGLLAHPVSLVLRGVLLVAIAAVWISLLNDQMPCFLGVPNCD